MKPRLKEGKRFLNCRFESIKKISWENKINHNLRITHTKHIKNNNTNFLYIPGQSKIINFKYSKNRKDKLIRTKKSILTKMEEIEKKHKELYFKKHGRNIQKNKTNSIRDNVLTFPKDMENDLKFEKFNKEEFIKICIKTIQNICKELDVELINVVVHFDETTPHCHFQTRNYNSDLTLSMNTIKTELGERIQDLRGLYFKKYGIIRGISKSETGATHTRDEIQKLQKTIEEQYRTIKSLNNSNNKMKKENEELKKENEFLKSDMLKLKTEIEDLHKTRKSFKEQIIRLEMETQKKKEIYNERLNPILNQLRYFDKKFQSKHFIKYFENRNFKDEKVLMKIKSYWDELITKSEEIKQIKTTISQIEGIVQEEGFKLS